MANYFIDTNVLLDENFLQLDGKLYISSITLNELEHIKTSGYKDEDIKYKARHALHWLTDNEDKYEVILYKEKFSKLIKKLGLPDSSDSKIIVSALIQKKEIKDLIFCTNDLACKNIARSVGLDIHFETDAEEEYTGYKEIIMNDDELANFYSHLADSKNIYNLLENQYLLIRNKGTIIDKYKWYENHYEPIPFQKIDSRMFGNVVAKDEDVYQTIAMDSLRSNQFTVLRGPAGSGKTILAMSYLFSCLERGEIDKIVVVCNPVAVRGAARLGFYPGDKNEKLLDSQVGNILISKLGDRLEVERMIDEGRLMLIPMSDIRGFDTTGLAVGYYITEAQNMDRDMMKLALQRVGEESVVICEGDDKIQTDLASYSGNNNGLRKAVEIFKGETLFGTVTLKNIKRSRIAQVAEKLC